MKNFFFFTIVFLFLSIVGKVLAYDQNYQPPVQDKKIAIDENLLSCQKFQPSYSIFGRYVDLAITSNTMINLTLTLRNDDSGLPGMIIQSYYSTSNESDDYIANSKMLRFTQPTMHAATVVPNSDYWLCLTGAAPGAYWVFGQPGTYDSGYLIHRFDGLSDKQTISDGDFGFEINSYSKDIVPSYTTTDNTGSNTNDSDNTMSNTLETTRDNSLIQQKEPTTNNDTESKAKEVNSTYSTSASAEKPSRQILAIALLSVLLTASVLFYERNKLNVIFAKRTKQ